MGRQLQMSLLEIMRVVETATNTLTIEKEKTDEEMDRDHVSYSIFCG